MRSVAVSVPAPKRRRVEGEEEEGGGEEGGEREMQHVVVKKGKKSALSDVFAEVKVSVERWRNGWAVCGL